MHRLSAVSNVKKVPKKRESIRTQYFDTIKDENVERIFHGLVPHVTLRTPEDFAKLVARVEKRFSRKQNLFPQYQVVIPVEVVILERPLTADEIAEADEQVRRRLELRLACLLDEADVIKATLKPKKGAKRGKEKA